MEEEQKRAEVMRRIYDLLPRELRTLALQMPPEVMRPLVDYVLSVMRCDYVALGPRTGDSARINCDRAMNESFIHSFHHHSRDAAAIESTLPSD